MEIGSSGAGTVAQNVPTQTGSQQQVAQAESQQQQQEITAQENNPLPGERVGSQINISV
jgi:hypothetical protein